MGDHSASGKFWDTVLSQNHSELIRGDLLDWGDGLGDDEKEFKNILVLTRDENPQTSM